MPKVAVCLSGCGVFDGSEIHEAVLTLLALDQAGAEVLCCAPDISQTSVVNHVDKTPMEEKRNVLVESARIARGNIKNLAEVHADQIDALIFPGGLGAAKNLSSYALQGVDCRVHADVERLVGEMLAAGKPIGAICIAPAMLARLLGKRGIKAQLTIGHDSKTAEAINKMGARHVACGCGEAVADDTYRIVSTPAYMLARGPAEVYEGIRKLVEHIIRWTKA